MNLLRASHSTFLFEKPELSQSLENGLILAVGGYCQRANNDLNKTNNNFLFKVKDYFVAMKQREGWLCNCPQGTGFAPTNDLYGHSGHICKHICAAAICFSVKQWPKPCKNIFELVERLVSIDYIISCAVPGNKKVKIFVYEEDELYNMQLKIGRKHSEALAFTDPFDNNKWTMNASAPLLYKNFVNSLQK